MENKGWYQKNSEIKIKEIVEDKYPNYKYLGGYTGADGKLTLKCKKCEYEFEYTAQIIRPSRNKTIVCKGCTDRKKYLDIKLKAINKYIKQLEKECIRCEREIRKQIDTLKKVINKECIECGQTFTTSKENVVYCSNECSKKYNNRKKDKRIYKNGKPDLSITLNKLIRRDKCICHICGAKCDTKDFYYKDSIFIAGEQYPSIDHVIAIANGGLHSWNNIKLAHRSCNSQKRDREYKIERNNQLSMWV